MLKDADELLWSRYEIRTVLLAVSELLNLKIKFNMMVNCYDRMVAIIRKYYRRITSLLGASIF